MSIGRVPGATGIQPSIVDAKGDLIVATAADSVDRLAVGTNGQYLKADSTTATGLAWATLPSSGKVLQVVMGSTSSMASNSTNTYADTGITATITPSATSSKILVFYSLQGAQKEPGNQYSQLETRLMRGATEIMHGGRSGGNNVDGYNYANQYGGYLDSPATTSATTYKLQFRNTQNVALVRVQGNGDELSTIILMEIGA